MRQMPRIPFFLQEEGELAAPIGTTIAPEMKRNFVEITLEAEQTPDEMPYFF